MGTGQIGQGIIDLNTKPAARPIMLLVGILLIGASLRAPITAIAPALGAIRDAFALTTTQVGGLTSLPLLVFAIASPLCAALARRCGLDRSLFLAMALIAGGILLRSLGPLWALFAGTGIIGLGIAIANVLLPSLLKRDFPKQIPNLTSLYVVMSAVVAALGSMIIVPIATMPDWGWKWALASFLILPLLALVGWAPQAFGRAAEPADVVAPPSDGALWKSALAWQVTLFFGLNSLVFYVIITWLPAMLIELGYSPRAAGVLHGLYQLVGAAAGLFVGPLATRLNNQKLLAALAAAGIGLSLAGLVLLPGWAILWTALLGVGGGATFILGLAFFSLRAASVRQAAALSAMAQTFGYTIAAAAPPLAGVLHDRTGSWTAPILVCVFLCGLMAALGYRAGRFTG